MKWWDMKSEARFKDIDRWVEDLISRWAAKEPKPMMDKLEKDMMLHIKDCGVHCPFCGFTGMERHPVDETSSQQGKLKQKRTCWQCGENWTIEYDMARVRVGAKVFDKLGEIGGEKDKRKAVIKRLIRYSRSLDW